MNIAHCPSLPQIIPKMHWSGKCAEQYVLDKKRSMRSVTNAVHTSRLAMGGVAKTRPCVVKKSANT